jgi:ribokinase
MNIHTEIDFLGVGDVVVDAFIQIKDAEVRCEKENNSCELCLRYGDKVPFESATILPAVGNSANAAVSASRLGLTSALVATIGDDTDGHLCKKTLSEDGVICDYIYTDKSQPTNYHYVLWHGVDRTILVKHAKFNYIFPHTIKAKWIYLSSLGESGALLHKEIITYLKNNPETKLSFQPGTFQMKLGIEALKEIYTHTDIFVCNVEEAERISGITRPSTKKDTLNWNTHIKEMVAWFHDKGPKIVSITDGPDGAYASDGSQTLYLPIYPDSAPPVERTGAGDAFASTFTTAIALGKTISEALQWGPINSMNVVQYIGAQAGLQKKEDLLNWLKNAPEYYIPKEI